MNSNELHTKRLKLRLVEHSDLMAVHNLHSLPETDEFNTLGIPESVDETEAVLKGWMSDNQKQEAKSYTFVIEKSASSEFVGLIALKLGNQKFRTGEVWYKLHVDHWNQGFGTEALNKVLNFGFEDLNLHRIEAGCAVGNTGSTRVLEKAGMTREGRKRQVLPLKSGWSDNFEYAITETDKRPLSTNNS